MDEQLVNNLKQQIIDELNLEEVKPEDIDASAPLFGDGGLGLDSIDALELIILVEKHYGLKNNRPEEGQGDIPIGQHDGRIHQSQPEINANACYGHWRHHQYRQLGKRKLAEPARLHSGIAPMQILQTVHEVPAGEIKLTNSQLAGRAGLPTDGVYHAPCC